MTRSGAVGQDGMHINLRQFNLLKLNEYLVYHKTDFHAFDATLYYKCFSFPSEII